MALAKEASKQLVKAERLRKHEVAGREEINPLNALLRLSARLGECFSPSAFYMLCCQWCKGGTASQSNLRYFIAYQSDEFALSEVVLAGDG